MWSYVSFWLAVFAGFAGGYIMALAAYWLESIFGIARLDFGHTGLRYAGGEKPGWWIVGIVFHLIDSVLLGLAYGAFVWPFLPGIGIPTRTLWGDAVGGMLFGVLLWVVLGMLIIMPMMGEGVFGYQARSARLAALYLALHVLFGLVVGVIYIPPGQ